MAHLHLREPSGPILGDRRPPCGKISTPQAAKSLGADRWSPAAPGTPPKAPVRPSTREEGRELKNVPRTADSRTSATGSIGPQAGMFTLGAAVGQAGQIISHRSLDPVGRQSRLGIGRQPLGPGRQALEHLLQHFLCRGAVGQNIGMSINARVQEFLQFFFLLGQLPRWRRSPAAQPGPPPGCRCQSRPTGPVADGQQIAHLPVDQLVQQHPPQFVGVERRIPAANALVGRGPQPGFQQRRRASSSPSSRASSASCVS